MNLERFQDKSITKLFRINRKVIGYSGHLYKDRGIELIIKAAQRNPEFEFYLAGGFKKDIEKYKNIVREINIGNIHFLGILPFSDIPAFLKACDYLIMPYSKTLNTIQSCSPLKLFEYMAAGKVIITSNIPTILEVLNQNNSLIFEADDYSELQEILNKIKKKEIDESKLIKNVLEDVKQFSWDKRAKYILEIFKSF